MISSRRSAGVGQGRDLGKRARELLYGFDQRRTFRRPLSRFAPQARGFLDQVGLGAVTRQQFRLVLGDLRELAFDGFGDTGVKRDIAMEKARLKANGDWAKWEEFQSQTNIRWARMRLLPIGWHERRGRVLP